MRLRHASTRMKLCPCAHVFGCGCGCVVQEPAGTRLKLCARAHMLLVHLFVSCGSACVQRGPEAVCARHSCGGTGSRAQQAETLPDVQGAAIGCWISHALRHVFTCKFCHALCPGLFPENQASRRRSVSVKVHTHAYTPLGKPAWEQKWGACSQPDGRERRMHTAWQTDV